MPISTLIEAPFLLDGGAVYHAFPEYEFSSSQVTNAFAVRPFLVPTIDDFSETGMDFVPLYLTFWDEEEEELDSRPMVTPTEVDGDYIQSVNVDYGALGGLLPSFGLPLGDFEPFEAPHPFILPVDVFSLCAADAQAGDELLYAVDTGIISGADDFFGEIEATSSLRTYPGFAGEEFHWSHEPGYGFVLEIEPGELSSTPFEVQVVNIAFVPWFEAFGEPTGNAAEDSARAYSTWLGLLDEFGTGQFAENLFLSNLEYEEAQDEIYFFDTLNDPQVWNDELASLEPFTVDLLFEGLTLDELGAVTNVFAQVLAIETIQDGFQWDALRFKYDFYDISTVGELPPVPYLGPVVTNDPETASSGGTVTYTGTDLDEVTSATIAGVSSTIVSKSPSALTLRVPAGLTQGMHDVDLYYGTTEVLTLQNGLIIENPIKVWTQLQTDNTVKMYAKNIIGEGKIQFFHNGNEIAWVRASNALNPKLREANGSHYLVRTRELVAGKNAFEIYQDGTRIWRAAYSR
jgi:hypothetical protein